MSSSDPFAFSFFSPSSNEWRPLQLELSTSEEWGLDAFFAESSDGRDTAETGLGLTRASMLDIHPRMVSKRLIQWMEDDVFFNRLKDMHSFGSWAFQADLELMGVLCPYVESAEALLSLFEALTAQVTCARSCDVEEIARVICTLPCFKSAPKLQARAFSLAIRLKDQERSSLLAFIQAQRAHLGPKQLDPAGFLFALQERSERHSSVAGLEHFPPFEPSYMNPDTYLQALVEAPSAQEFTLHIELQKPRLFGAYAASAQPFSSRQAAEACGVELISTVKGRGQDLLAYAPFAVFMTQDCGAFPASRAARADIGLRRQEDCVAYIDRSSPLSHIGQALRTKVPAWLKREHPSVQEDRALLDHGFGKELGVVFSHPAGKKILRLGAATDYCLSYPSPSILPAALNHVRQLIDDALDTPTCPFKQVGEIYWWLCRTQPWQADSPAISACLARILLLHSKAIKESVAWPADLAYQVWLEPSAESFASRFEELLSSALARCQKPSSPSSTFSGLEELVLSANHLCFLQKALDCPKSSALLWEFLEFFWMRCNPTPKAVKNLLSALDSCLRKSPHCFDSRSLPQHDPSSSLSFPKYLKLLRAGTDPLELDFLMLSSDQKRLYTIVEDYGKVSSKLALRYIVRKASGKWGKQMGYGSDQMSYGAYQHQTVLQACRAIRELPDMRSGERLLRFLGYKRFTYARSMATDLGADQYLDYHDYGSLRGHESLTRVWEGMGYAPMREALFAAYPQWKADPSRAHLVRMETVPTAHSHSAEHCIAFRAQLGDRVLLLDRVGKDYCYHTPVDHVDGIREAVHDWIDALLEQSQMDEKVLMEDLGRIFWWTCRGKFWIRGDPSIAELCVRSLALDKGVEIGAWKVGIVPWEAVMKEPCPEHFAKSFSQLFENTPSRRSEKAHLCADLSSSR